MPAGALQGIELQREFLPASMFVVRRVAGGDSFEVRQELLPFCQAVTADLMANARRQDLVGTPPTNTEDEFYGLAIDPRQVQGADGCNDLVQACVPDWFVRHMYDDRKISQVNAVMPM